MEWSAQLRMQVGEQRTIRLTGFSSGGYRWQAHIASPSEAVSVFVNPSPEPTTAPGSRDELLTILGTAAGRATVDVTLTRSWEPEPVERHTLVVIVEEPASTTR